MMKITNYETADYVVIRPPVISSSDPNFSKHSVLNTVSLCCSFHMTVLSFKPVHSNGVTLNYLSERCTVSSYWVT
jgi:hypothetical protein